MTPNDEALARFTEGDAVLLGIAPARETLPALASSLSLSHAGPPISLERMCGPMRAALAGAVVFEGWADSLTGADALLASGAIRLTPNHETDAVSPMAGVISPSMLTFVVENPVFRNRVAAIGNEGNHRDTLRCGANGPATITRLHWLNAVVMPELAAALAKPVSLRDIIARAVLMGDELHQRNVAATALFLEELLPRLSAGSPAMSHLLASSQFFLNLGMASSKALLDPLSGIAGCSLVTAMSRNGVDFGIRVSATGDRWFTAPAAEPRGVYFPPYSRDDANPDIGDSAIVETAGLGGFNLVNAPGVHALVGCGGRAEAASLEAEMWTITVASNPHYRCSPADDLGTPFGIDVFRVAEAGVTPVITTGIAHRDPGGGQVGAGLVRPPLACFAAAAEALRTAAVPA